MNLARSDSTKYTPPPRGYIKHVDKQEFVVETDLQKIGFLYKSNILI